MGNAEQLREWLGQYKRNIFLGGAGVSTASGIPDFRSAHGLYMAKKQGISYEEMLSHDYYVEHTEEFYDFLRHVMLYPDAKPNSAHYALAKLEREGRLEAVITQNIDGLHQAAGSQNVIELHGNEDRYLCQRCGKTYDMRYVMACEGVPHCQCGGGLKPDVVLYGEQLNQRDLSRAVWYAMEAQLMVVGGTSLVVYPVAGLVDYLKPQAKLVIINRDPTPYDSRADLLIREDVGTVLAGAAGLE
ncbi:NAD-dependent protein deacylase [Oscillospiraceae bacterium 42-9]|uniref:NAD-dependent protein deacylase n=1 Tax=Acutalibacter sp. TaxID=1918636 RepID=UPI00216D811D|nr:NAD-dependent protein deacylase [Acutalibacter sp.]